MSDSWEIEAAVSPVCVMLLDGTVQLLVRVAIAGLEDPDPAAVAFTGLPSAEARWIASETLAAADDADWQTDQDGCPQPREEAR